MNTIAYIETPADRNAGIPRNVITIDFGIRTDIHTRPEHREELRQTLRNFAEDYLGDDPYSVLFNDECVECGTVIPACIAEHPGIADKCPNPKCPSNTGDYDNYTIEARKPAPTPQYLTINELAKEALAVQNASNIVGVAQSFAAAMVSLSKHLGSTDEVAKHPITAAWVDKLKSLTGTICAGYSWDRDYELLNQLAKGGTDAETGEEK